MDQRQIAHAILMASAANAEVEGLKVANAVRAGQDVAYGSDYFFDIAARLRNEADALYH